VRLFLLIILTHLYLAASNELCIDEAFIHGSTLNHQLVFEDRKNQFSFETIDKIPFEKKPIGLTRETPSTFWVKFHLKNVLSHDVSIIFKHPRSGVDFIKVYLFEDGKLVALHQLGDLSDPSKRQIIYRNSLFMHTLKQNRQYTVVAQMRSYGPYELYWSIEDTGYFLKQGSIETMIWGMFAGLLIALALYNLILYVSFRERAFLMYVLHIVSIAIYQMGNNGILYHYLSQWINVKLLTVGGWIFPYLSLAFLLIFAYDFFNLRGSLWGKILKASAVVSFFVALFYTTALWNMEILYYTRYLTLISLAVPLLIVALSLNMMYQKKLASFYFFLGQSIYIFAISYYILSITDFIKTENDAWLVVVFGILGDLIFLSLALGKRMRSIQQENEQNSKLIGEQSRFILVGQIVGNVTHQWKAPISKLSSQIMLLQAIFSHQKNRFVEEFEKMIPEINANIDFMQKNIDLFQNFYKYSDKKKWFNPIDEIGTIRVILEDRLIVQNIECQIGSEIKMLDAHKSAFKNIMMICFENSINALSTREGQRIIRVGIYALNEQTIRILFQDNAPTLGKQQIDTPEIHEGCGLGLPLATLLANKQLSGSFKAINTSDGWTTFELVFHAEQI